MQMLNILPVVGVGDNRISTIDSTGVGHTCAGLTVDKINVVLPVVMGLIPFKCSGMTGDDLAIGNNRNVRWVDVNADDTIGQN